MARQHKLNAYNDIIKLAYENGQSLNTIAQAHGASLGTIRNILKRLGVQLRKPGRPNGK